MKNKKIFLFILLVLVISLMVLPLIVLKIKQRDTFSNLSKVNRPSSLFASKDGCEIHKEPNENCYRSVCVKGKADGSGHYEGEKIVYNICNDTWDGWISVGQIPL